jgi:hypothetical protein
MGSTTGCLSKSRQTLDGSFHIPRREKLSDETVTTDAAPAQEVPKPAAPEVFSKEYVQELRNEAAKYRTDKNNAVEAARAEVIKDYESKLSERESAFSKLQGELSDRALELLKLKAVVSAGISTEDALDVVSLVQGSDEESVSESVSRVKSLIGKNPPKDRPIDPSQGTGNQLPLNGDPLLETVRRIVGAK